jgi:AcrR family transcriptional regulator
VARPAKFSEASILDAATVVVARHGPGATIAQVAAELGAPVGSLYYRFPSREALMVSLWVRSIRRFHEGLFAAAALEDPDRALIESALHIPRFCRMHPEVAATMVLFRHEAAVRTAPESIRDEVVRLNDPLLLLQADLIRRRWGRVTPTRTRLISIAVRQSPYGLVRPYVGGDLPVWLDDVVEAATVGILGLVR